MHVSYFGLILAIIFYATSVSPSLLPRRWWWHAFVSGTLMGSGYLIGWGLETVFFWLGRTLHIQIIVPPALMSFASTLTLVLVGAWAARLVVRSHLDSRRAAEKVGMKPVSTLEYLLGFASSFLMFAFVYQVNEWLRAVYDLGVNILGQWFYQPAAAAVSILGVLLLVFIVSNKVVFKAGLALFSRKAAQLNTTTGGGFDRPTAPELSGSPASLSDWETIGGQGRKFLTLGPSASDIEAVTGKPAMQPIRVYAGLPESDSALEPVADLVVEELRRTGAFDRSVIVVNTTTGSGWVDEWLVQPVEYLTGGDCAIATMQYSYLFSAALLVTSLDPCAEAGTLLYEKVADAIADLPEDERPLLYVTGESLGAYGSQAAFEDLEEAQKRIDGAVWVGSPNQSALWREGTRGRDRGSPEVAPVYGLGRNVRFVNEPSQLTVDIYGRPLGEWCFPRLAFVQHASDPVVWYDVPLMWDEPDWLRERDGLDVSASMSYTPGLTYLQVLADLPVAGGAPSGHGHTYHQELIDVWYYVLGFDGGAKALRARNQALDHHDRALGHQTQALGNQTQSLDHQTQALGHQTQSLDHHDQALRGQPQSLDLDCEARDAGTVPDHVDERFLEKIRQAIGQSMTPVHPAD